MSDKQKSSGIMEIDPHFSYSCMIPVSQNLKSAAKGSSGISPWPSYFGLPVMRGLRYKITYEIAGVNPECPPELEDYMPNWATKNDETRALNYFKSKYEQRSCPTAKKHMKAILEQRKAGREMFKRALRLWCELADKQLAEQLDNGETRYKKLLAKARV
jgi:hypothetical protein